MLPVPLRVDVAPHAPAVARGVAPVLDVRVAPRAEGVLDRAVLGEERVAHAAEAVGGGGGGPVVAFGGGLVGDGVYGLAVGLVLVGGAAEPELGDVFPLVEPFFGDVAVVVLEVCSV